MVRMKLPNGYGSISKLTGKRRNPYMVRKTIGMKPNGQQIMDIIGYYHTYQDAMEALINYNKSGGLKDVSDFTFKAVYEALCAEKYEKKGKDIPSPYSNAYKRCKELSDLCFSSLNLFHYEKIIEKTETPVLKRDVKTLLGLMYKYAIAHSITDKNIAQYIENPELVKSTMHKAITDDELKFLWNHSDEWMAKVWLIYCYTGLRPSELILIKTENVHLDEQYMIGGIKTKASKNRIIPIADCILPFIKSFYNPKNKTLMMKDDGIPMNYGNVNWQKDLFEEAHNFHHKLHDGRHTFATMGDDAGIPLLIIQTIMGHKPKELAEDVYIHKDVPQLLEAVNKLKYYSA